MTDENTWWKNLKDTRWYYIIAVACASGVYFGNIINIFYGLIYMQASALAGASIFPAIVGSIVGVTVCRILFRFPNFSIVLAIALGAATHAIIGSFLVQPVNGIEGTFFVSYGQPIKSFSVAFFGGIVSGIILAFLIKKRIGFKDTKNSH